ncbi:rRNA maturation RNase YbeY [Borrelia sp. BU AG58]|uniref:rRNA maturation RNase YbeY n=1 Tax=Borrelia sp. BU AG58 TaxID=2887345 RepID=UPI001E36311B|nr:rRNA maturation RNase YbeY [Borrelia sp. BU AG58]UER67277.1 rRNA maturation RNase YbeY [Borrelia sp. BU AG58]
MEDEGLNLWAEDVEFEYLDVYRGFVLSVLECLCVREFELSVVLCSNAYIQKLNIEFRQRFEPTDVLSFNYLEEGGGRLSRVIEGDLVISLEYLRLSALEFGVEMYDELQRVTIHGILHLIGYDHKTNDFQKEEMLIIQEQVLRQTRRVF